MKLQKLGGYASIVLFCVSIGMGVMLTIIFGGFASLLDIFDPAKMIAAYQDSFVAFWVYYILGILSGILTLFIVFALNERMQAKAPNLMRLAVIAASAYSALFVTTMIGGFFRNILLMGMNDASAFRAFLVLHEFLDNAATSMLGWGLLLIGATAISTRLLPRLLSYAILVFGIMSILKFAFTVSQFQIGLAINVLLALIVFVWLGVVLLRKPESSVA
jgi:hypothetical protein